MQEELRKSFHEEIDQVKAKVLKMMAYVIDSLPRVANAYLLGDYETAQEIIEKDDILDAWSVELESQCATLLTLQQPMATDLRAILACYSINSDVERIGDLVCNIARNSQRLHGTEIDPQLRGFLSKMSDECRLLVKLAMDSFAEGDRTLAASLHELDDRLDGLNRDFFAAVLKSQKQNEMGLDIVVNLALTSRYFERIGDHTVNVGERVCYMLDGWTKEQLGAARARAKGLLDNTNPFSADAPAADISSPDTPEESI